MKILTVCDQGNNRSITLASQLKYMDYDVLSAGLSTNTPEMLHLLFDWADWIIATDQQQYITISRQAPGKTVLWDIGPDIYKRPFNPELLSIVRNLVAQYEPALRGQRW